VALARGLHPPRPPYWSDVAIDSVQARAYVGTYRAAQPLPYGSGPFGVSWSHGGLVASNQGTPADFMLPQAPGVFLLRNVWSEMRFTQAPGGGGPRATLRPLWLKTEAVELERAEAAAR